MNLSCRNSKFILVTFLFSLLIVCVTINVSTIQALNQNEMSESLVWTDGPYYQGEVEGVTLTITSYSDVELRITSVGIKFSWNDEDRWYLISDETNSLPSGAQQVSYDSRDFTIGTNTEVGWNDYELTVYGEERGFLGWSNFQWSATGNVYVRDASEKVYRDRLSVFVDNYNSINSLNYEGSEARAIISQSLDAYELAKEYASNENWTNAISSLSDASDYLTESTMREESYQMEQSNIEDLQNAFWEEYNKFVDQYNLLINSGYSSPVAKTMIDNTMNNLDLAEDYFDAGQYDQAISELSRAIEQLTEASFEEDQYIEETERTSITVFVRDSDDNAVSGASIISTTQPSSQRTLEGTSRTDGSVTFSSLEPGSYYLKVEKEFYEEKTTSISVQYGLASDVTLIIDKVVGDLIVTMKDINQNLLVEATLTSTSEPSGQTKVSGVTDSQGVIHFRDIHVGSYTFNVQHPDYVQGSFQVSISSGETTEIREGLDKKGIPGLPLPSILFGLLLVYSFIRKRSPISRNRITNEFF